MKTSSVFSGWRADTKVAALPTKSNKLRAIKFCLKTTPEPSARIQTPKCFPNPSTNNGVFQPMPSRSESETTCISNKWNPSTVSERAPNAPKYQPYLDDIQRPISALPRSEWRGIRNRLLQYCRRQFKKRTKSYLLSLVAKSKRVKAKKLTTDQNRRRVLEQAAYERRGKSVQVHVDMFKASIQPVCSFMSFCASPALQ